MGHEKTKLGRVRAMLSLGSFSYCWLVANFRKAKTVSTSVSGPWRHTECTGRLNVRCLSANAKGRVADSIAAPTTTAEEPPT